MMVADGPAKNGFTLIELLIVLVLIGIITTFAVLAIGDFGKTKQIETIADELPSLIYTAQQQAILQPALLALSLRQDGYLFFRFIEEPNNQGHWQSICDNDLLKCKHWPAGTEVNYKVDKDPLLSLNAYVENGPLIIFSSTGEFTPFEIEFGKHAKPPLFCIVGKGNGTVKVIQGNR